MTAATEGDGRDARDPAGGPLREHRLAPAHIEGGLALSALAGWNQLAADWRLFFAIGHGWGMSSADGRLAATTMIVPYAPSFAWVSVVLVDPAFRRRGLATRLTERALEALEASGRAAVLDATPAGREVYLRLGFRDAWSLERLLSRSPPARAAGVDDPIGPSPAGLVVRPIAPGDWPRLLAYDTAVFGAPREAMLRDFAARLPAAAFLAERRGRLCGVLLGRDGRLSAMLGPLVADTPAIGAALLAAALDQVPAPLAIDVPSRQLALKRWLELRGFAIGRPFSRMVYGASVTAEDAGRLLASAGPEFG